MTIKAVGFDLDDTLYSRSNFYKFIYEIMEDSVINTGHSFSNFYEVFQRYSDLEYEKFIREGKSKVAYKNDRVIKTYKELDADISENEAIIFNSLYLYFRNKIMYREGIEDLFEMLLKNNIELFILTNGPSEDQRNKIKELNVEYYIHRNRWFISDELKCSKPDLQIFKKVEEILGFQKEEIVYIGDNYINDIVGAKEAGWEAILLNVHQYEKTSEEFFIVDKIEQIKSLNIFL